MFETMLRAYKAGLEYATVHDILSRFDVAIYLYGYEPNLTFEQIIEITRVIAIDLDRHQW